ncbi:CYTH domain-containing protein [Evansella cellulosilytica]|uniref:Adenylate cyclase n=1 Tax=Evansella cellulosilytica (strain ATCC 21833 / DSM 2522 / FERM P-1141 / JCM 9156 / N-4) TaxID=649639 RepID=E6TX57_EVAC2|nr:CYTH domain-containing protein [Evansella cellulosilytica]ADU31146.1 adenylate cyclase [Evansella cellulosilytica DSM 2522]
MSHEIEIEFKNILTEEEYSRLLQTYSIHLNDVISQVNYYFDTKDMDLKNNRCALRIRNKETLYTLTLKQSSEENTIFETHQSLNKEEFEDAISYGHLPKGDVTHQLISIIPHSKNVQYLGKLTTERAEKNLVEGLLVLDKSYYFDTVDYELEFECDDVKSGQAFFNQLLEKNRIPKRKTDSKMSRFFQKKIEEE